MIDGLIVGDVEIVRKFEAMGPRLRSEMGKGIGRLTLKLQTIVKRDKLSGQVLGVRTGRGRRSIQQVVVNYGDKVAGIVSTAVFYMIGWETGWGGGATAVASSLTAAKARFKPQNGSFGTGGPRQRSFLKTELADLHASGAIAQEMDAAIARATP